RVHQCPDQLLQNPYTMTADPEARILRSWQRNAASWIRAIEQNEIHSRTGVTNAAMVTAILSLKPTGVLDIGCGEGWLCRALHGHGIATCGLDAIPELIASARQSGPQHYEVAAYEDLKNFRAEPACDVAVCNFSLLGNESVEQVFDSLPALLPSPGHFVIQTLHPDYCLPERPAADGWLPGSWTGFNDGFRDPPPWYYRTVAGWHDLFTRHHLELQETREPAGADGLPVSIIFISRRRN
ncbi:MAG: class I SAM-dependent methyltransferase, partial [Pseudohongiellaceae bacterium]